jgi:phenylalanyl-tRNA synthetase beta chain
VNTCYMYVYGLIEDFARLQFTGTNIKEEHWVYVIAIPANRYDLLCMEGFARAFRIFIGLEPSPLYRRVDPAGGRQVMTVSESTNAIRPFVVSAILRGVKFDARRYKSFIDLQDKLHQNICRKRTLVAIGTHDLDTLKGPFRYVAQSPEAINFVPLTEDNGKSFAGKELLDLYRTNNEFKHLKPYTDIIYDSPVYPVIYDSQGVVLSMPPIINGKHSRIQLHTENVFIECTGTDLTKCNIVLDTVVTMFSQYCAEPFTVEAVDVVYESGGLTEVTPRLSQRTCDAAVSEINGTIGIEIGPDRITELCNRMQLGPATYSSATGMVTVTVPPTRSDVLHAVDVIEDIAIAYGYNNIPQSVPNTVCVGASLPINRVTDLLRVEIANAGYMEMLTHGLCSRAENFTKLRRPIGPAVSLENPANVEYEVVRTTLLPGALKTLAHNKSISHKDGVKLFEISDIVLPADNEVGAINVRKLVGVHAGHRAGFEIIHGLVDRVLTALQICPEDGYAANSLSASDIEDYKRVGRSDVVYTVRATENPTFFPGMSAEVVLRRTGASGNSSSNKVTEQVVGILGVIHPEVLGHYEITYPCSIVELDLESLM